MSFSTSTSSSYPSPSSSPSIALDHGHSQDQTPNADANADANPSLKGLSARLFATLEKRKSQGTFRSLKMRRVKGRGSDSFERYSSASGMPTGIFSSTYPVSSSSSLPSPSPSPSPTPTPTTSSSSAPPPPSSSMIDFSSNDYLSLTSSRRYHEIFFRRIQEVYAESHQLPGDHGHGREYSKREYEEEERREEYAEEEGGDSINGIGLFGSTGSRLLDGTTRFHLALEERLGDFFDYPRHASAVPASASASASVSASSPPSALSGSSSLTSNNTTSSTSTSTDLTSTSASGIGLPPASGSSSTKALLFNSGFDANTSFFSSIPSSRDYIIYDSLIHASVWDGMRTNERRGVSKERRWAFSHNDPDAFEKAVRSVVAVEQGAPRLPGGGGGRDRNGDGSSSSSSSSSGGGGGGGIKQRGAPKGTSPSTSNPGTIFIALESLYSMDGDYSPLNRFCDILDKLELEFPQVVNPDNVCVIVDEAHTTGVVGKGGRGEVWRLVAANEAAAAAAESQVKAGAKNGECGGHNGTGGSGNDRRGSGRRKNASNRRPITDWIKVRVMTFGKAVGAQGAVLLAPPLFLSYLHNFARPFIYSTASSIVSLLAIESAFDVLISSEGQKRRRKLMGLCQILRGEVEGLIRELKVGKEVLSLLPGAPEDEHQPQKNQQQERQEREEETAETSQFSPILPIITPHPHSLALHLQSRGFLVRPVVSPTVPVGQERVRICLHSSNRVEEIKGLRREIEGWVRGKMMEGMVKAKL